MRESSLWQINRSSALRQLYILGRYVLMLGIHMKSDGGNEGIIEYL